MLIAIDASRAVREQPTGTELYSTRLIQGLAQLDSDNTYFLYTPTEPPANFGDLPDNFHWRVIPMRRFWTQLRLSWALWQDKPDLLFVPAHVLPLYLPKKTIVTLHDIAFEVFPQAYSWFSRWYNRYAVRRAGRYAMRIITPSQATADDLVRIYGLDKHKITPIHLGFDDRFSRAITIPTEIKKLQPYILSIGRLETRKNTATTIEAFGQYKKEHSDQPLKLVLIGKPGYGFEAVQAAITALPKEIQEAIIEPGYIDDEMLAAYMKGATAYVSPTLYEGFGLTVLEAMAAGIPVITSDTSSLPEVVGDAAILVDPQSPEQVTKAIRILTINDLSHKELAKKGKEQATHFSWQKMAHQTLDVIKDIL